MRRSAARRSGSGRGRGLTPAQLWTGLIIGSCHPLVFVLARGQLELGTQVSNTILFVCETRLLSLAFVLAHAYEHLGRTCFASGIPARA
jgi:hypothetical protein